MPALPRSLLLHCFDARETTNAAFLFVGLSNGSVMMHPFTGKSIGGGKIVSLGEAPVTLRRCRLDRRISIFAAGTRSALFFWERDAPDHMSVLVKVCYFSILPAIRTSSDDEPSVYYQDISSVCPLHTSAHPSSLLLSSSEGLTIGRIRDEDRKDIRTVRPR